MQGMQEQRGGEIDGLKIRPESGTDFLLIWALSVRTLLFMLPRRCAVSEISCCFVECSGQLKKLFSNPETYHKCNANNRDLLSAYK